ncbi:MAG: hypothetical protein ACP5HG_08660 [Anaerolineae bacterium]
MEKRNDAVFATLAYVIPIVGPLYVLLARKVRTEAVPHPLQALVIHLSVFVIPLLWGVVAWPLSWLPIAGPLVSATLFSLVILAYIYTAIVWIVGLVHAIQGKPVLLPLIWNLSRGWLLRLFSPEARRA